MELTERAVHAEIVHWLRSVGASVFEIGKARAVIQCRKCKASNYPSGWQGNTPGCPDMFVLLPGSLNGRWIAVEVKKPGGQVRPTQRKYIREKKVVAVHSLEEMKQYLSLLEGENIDARVSQTAQTDKEDA